MSLHFEITIKDETFRKVGNWKFDKRDACARLNDINKIFGLGLKIKSANEDSDKDLDWLK